MRKLKRLFLALAALLGLGFLWLMTDMWNALGAWGPDKTPARHQSSPQWDGKRFTNRLPERMDFGLMLKRYWHGSPVASAAPGSVPMVPLDARSLDQPPKSGLRLTWFGHSSFYLEIDGLRVLVDPVWGPRASPSAHVGPKRFHAVPVELEDLPVPDAVLFSHDHYDHLDAPTVRRMAGWKTRFLAPLGLDAHLRHWGVPPERIEAKDWWEELRLKGVTLACVPARHFSGRRVLDKNRTLWSGWAVVGPKHRVYVSGDTAYFHEFKEIGRRYGPFDASVIEVGSYDPSWPDVHVGPEQAVQAHQDLKGGLLLPVHWGTFNLGTHGWTEPIERTLAAAQAKGVRVAVPKPGESLEPANAPPLQRWWPSLPWQAAGQAPVVSTGL